MNPEQQQFEPDPTKVGCALAVILGLSCLIFGPVALIVFLLIGAVVAPFVALICIIKLVTYTVMGTIDETKERK